MFCFKQSGIIKDADGINRPSNRAGRGTPINELPPLRLCKGNLRFFVALTLSLYSTPSGLENNPLQLNISFRSIVDFPRGGSRNSCAVRCCTCKVRASPILLGRLVNYGRSESIARDANAATTAGTQPSESDAKSLE